MESVKDVFDLAIELDLYKLAHRVYWAIAQGNVSLTDSSRNLEQIEYDEGEIQEMVERNTLGIGIVQLFVIQTRTPNWFAFYLSKSGLEAHSMHVKIFREKPVNIVKAERLMIPLMTFAESNTEMSIYEYRKKLIEIPAYLGHAESGRHVLYKLPYTLQKAR